MSDKVVFTTQKGVMYHSYINQGGDPALRRAREASIVYSAKFYCESESNLFLVFLLKPKWRVMERLFYFIIILWKNWPDP